MVCCVCKKSSDSVDCFNDALEILKQHFIFYKNSLDHRNEELQGIKERNEQLNKALELLQKSQQPSKKFKTNDNKWLPPPPQVPPDKNNGDVGNNSTSCLTDISLTDEDDAGTAGGSNLNMALNSEQLFETTIISPAKKPEVSPIATSASEMITSPHAKLMPRRNKQKENIRLAVDRNKILEKSKSELSVKETTTSQSKSWAMTLLKPSSSVLPKVVSAKEKKVGIDKKPEKKLNLSLKKVNPSKMKQSILHFNNSKDSSAIESDVCEDVIDASPVTCKSSRTAKSWAHRSGNNHSSRNSSSPINNSNTDLNIEDNKPKHDETVSSIPIENIVFDFSPSKKQDISTSNKKPVSKAKLNAKQQLNFTGDLGNDTTTDCVALPSSDQTVLSKSGDSSSVVLLTPATQDIIFLDDTDNDFSDIDTMDLLADIRKHETAYMQNLKKYESKNIEMKQKPVERPLVKPKDEDIFIKPVSCIKKEKHSQKVPEVKSHKNESEMPSTSSKKQNYANPLLASEPEQYEEEEEEEDIMPKPFVIKQEQEIVEITKKFTIKERFNIDCDECEKLPRILGPHVTNKDLEVHLRKCIFHNRSDIMRQNTPENFWNPFILSFEENDPRNEVLIDKRFSNRNK